MNKQFPHQSGTPRPATRHSGPSMGLGNSGDDNRIKIILVVLAGLIFAPILGTMLAQGEFFQLTIAGSALTAVIYIAFLSSSWPLVAWIFASIGLMYQPMGFLMGSLEMGSLLAGLFFLATFWRKSKQNVLATLESFRPFLISFVLFSSYLCVHALYSHSFPYNNELMSIQNSAKTYFAMWAGFFILSASLYKPELIRLPKNIYYWFGLFLLLGLVLNIAIRLYGIWILNIDERSEILSPTQFRSIIFVPILNITENAFSLRGLGPISALFSAVVLTSKNPLAREFRTRLISSLLLALGLAGSLLGAGRATLLVGILGICVVLFFRGRIGTVLTIPIASLVLLIAAQMTYNYDKKILPASIQRSLAILPFMDMKEASNEIEGSSNWRYELFEMGLNEWKQTTRTLLIGRGGYAWTDADTFAGDRDPYYGSMISALRRGATHNLFTDLAVIVGAIGFILYLTAYGTIILGLVRLTKRVPQGSQSRDFAFMGLIYLSLTLFESLLGGNYFSITAALIVSLAILMTTRATDKARAS